MMEQWKDVVGYDGLYEVSNLGRIRNSKRKTLVTPFKNERGYLRCELWKNNRRKRYRVHRIVANAWIPKIDGKTHINHINEVKTDNRVENLEWCTQAYNNSYGTHNLRVKRTWIKKSVSYQLKERGYVPLW